MHIILVYLKLFMKNGKIVVIQFCETSELITPVVAFINQIIDNAMSIV